VTLTGALASAREHGFAPDRAEIVIRGLCSGCRGD
jgi:Fe2+ or Zn2+ uptake regulation protein